MATPRTGRPRGRPKGSKSKKTVEKEVQREIVRQRIGERVLEVVDAQLDNATGLKHLMLRDEAGQFKRLTDPKEIDEACASGNPNLVWIYTKDPNHQSGMNMLAYAIDRPKDPPQDVNLNVTGQLETRMHEGRNRVAKAKKRKG